MNIFKFIHSSSELTNFASARGFRCFCGGGRFCAPLISPLILPASLLIELTSFTLSIFLAWSRLVPPLTSATVMPVSRAPGDCVDGDGSISGVELTCGGEMGQGELL